MCCRGGRTEPSIGTRLHDLPDDVLHAIMGRLPGNDVAKLASAHPALRRALQTLPSLQPSLLLEVTLDCGGVRTRRDTAAGRSHRRRRDDFGAFRVAHPHLAFDALTVRVALPAGVLRRLRRSTAPVDWLPLRSLKQLCVETSHIGNVHGGLRLSPLRAARDGFGLDCHAPRPALVRSKTVSSIRSAAVCARRSCCAPVWGSFCRAVPC